MDIHRSRSCSGESDTHHTGTLQVEVLPRARVSMDGVKTW